MIMSDNRGRSEKMADSVDAVGRKKFPFWTAIFRRFFLLFGSVLYWGFWASVMAVGFSWLVGFQETWVSVKSFVGGVSWVFGNVGLVSDSVVGLLIVVYMFWALEAREVLSVERREYTGDGGEWKSLRFDVVGGLVVSGFYAYGWFVDASWFGYAFGGVIWLSYLCARGITKTVREDKELESWFRLEYPWKVPAWLGLGYGLYAFVEGGIAGVPQVVDVLSLFVPIAVGVAYIVRREIGVRWGSGGMSSSDVQKVKQGRLDEVDADVEDDADTKEPLGVGESQMSLTYTTEEDVEQEDASESDVQKHEEGEWDYY
jgi:hypothetical protein